MAALLEEILEFIKETKMGPAYFGKKAVNNSELVERLRRGRSIQIDTAEKVRAFIKARRDAAAKAANRE